MIYLRSYTFPTKESMGSFLVNAFDEVEQKIDIVDISSGYKKFDETQIKLFVAIYGVYPDVTKIMEYKVKIEWSDDKNKINEHTEELLHNLYDFEMSLLQK